MTSDTTKDTAWEARLDTFQGMDGRWNDASKTIFVSTNGHMFHADGTEFGLTAEERVLLVNWVRTADDVELPPRIAHPGPLERDQVPPSAALHDLAERAVTALEAMAVSLSHMEHALARLSPSGIEPSGLE